VPKGWALRIMPVKNPGGQTWEKNGPKGISLMKIPVKKGYETACRDGWRASRTSASRIGPATDAACDSGSGEDYNGFA